ncbi:MAG: hypothetical protein ACEPO8_14385 [Rhodothermaceae bacterium]
MKSLLSLILIVCLTLCGIYYYFGGFEELEISKSSRGFMIVYQQIDQEDTRLNYLLDNLASYLEREKNITTDISFEYSGTITSSKKKVRLTGFIIKNQFIKGKLRKDIKMKTLVRTKCVSGKFPYKNNLSELIFDYAKRSEFEEYLDLQNIIPSQILKITDKKNQIIELIVPEKEWKIQ